MALARVYSVAHGRIGSSLHDGYLDRLGRWSDIQEYMPYLYECACSYTEVRVLELGTRTGNSTLAFLAAAEKTGGHVWSSDIADVARHPAGMGPWSQNRYWTFVHGDDMDEAVYAALPAWVDVLFIDTSHGFRHTLEECRAYVPRVAPGGVALFHDTNLTGWGGNPPLEGVPEVAQALDAYCGETGLTWENRPGKYGLGVVRIPERNHDRQSEAAGTDRDRSA